MKVKIVVFVGVFLVLVVMIASINSRPNHFADAPLGRGGVVEGSEAEREAMARRNPEVRLKVEKVDWTTGGFGSVMVADLTIRNRNTFNVKDMAIECQLYGASGTQVSTARHTIYEIIEADKVRTFAKVNMGFVNSQSEKANCRVAKAEASQQ